ncbi:hypothetical protein SAMD00019534_059480, partial [Acytostelium subglobosum LB1]|uniref:hypothetical protein n=1 Tax=Acytostelium subglobosum LB1 TaxID=1410327 RepID=UPI000644ED0D
FLKVVQIIIIYYIYIRMDDDAPLKRRLIAKETPMKKAFKKYLAFVATLENSASTPEQCQAAHQALLSELSLFEFQVQKATVLCDVNKKEMDYYSTLYSTRGQDIERVKAELVELKERLAHEKIQRQYKEQYLALYKLINDKPSIPDTEREIAKVKKELEAIMEQGTRTNEKLEMRTKQFQLLLHTVQELEQSLDTDDNKPLTPIQTLSSSSQAQATSISSSSSIVEDKMEI